MDKETSTVRQGSFISKFIKVVMMAVVALAPILFLPLPVLGFDTAKFILIAGGGVAILFLWGVLRLRDNDVAMPFNLISLASILILLTYAVSTLFSGSMATSFFGEGIAIDSFLSILLMFVFFALASSLFRTKGDAFYLHSVLFIPVVIVTLVQVVRLGLAAFGIGFPTLGFFADLTVNTVGKWNDLAVFLGLGLILAVAAIEMLVLPKAIRIALSITAGAGVALLAVISFQMLWYVLGAIALVMFVYFLSLERTKDGVTNVPVVPLLILLASVVFIIANTLTGSLAGSLFKINYFEVRPSFESTIDVIKSSLGKSPVIGVGPNLFGSEWSLSKPVEVNQTIFWNTNFMYGFGFIPTLLATTGVLGFAAWLFFMGLIVFYGIRLVFAKVDDRATQYLSVSTFLATVYLWVMLVIYVPSLVTLLLTFIFTGLLVGRFYDAGILSAKRFKLNKDPRHGFIYVFSIVFILIFTIIGGYLFAKRVVAQVYFEKAAIELSVNGNIDAAQQRVGQALSIHGDDVYYRGLSEIYILRIQQLFAAQGISQEDLRAQFQEIMSRAVASAQEAQALDPQDYRNFVALGNIYNILVDLQVEGAYENAKAQYEEAFKLAPRNPEILLSLARLEVSQQNNAAARDYIRQAIELKGNYTDAVFLLAQIDVSENNIQQAIANVEAAATIAPNDAAVFFQLGLLRYSAEQYEGAIPALERAVLINNYYSNAKYFLGLAYAQVGRTEDAIAQFEDLKYLNPGNQEVELILNNLKAGNSPFSGAEPPIDDEPESREELPLEEEESPQPEE